MDVKASFMTYLDQLKRSQSDPSLGRGNPAKAMSCEGCALKFTVFKRKKLCNICLRYFCTHCLSPQLGPNGNNSVLARLTDRRHICATCLVLTARPLCRLQLRRLKVKDLQHYLTAQRVSTHGCVEKDDLVNLLIRHVGSTNSGSWQENVCNSHTDLSTGNEGNSPNPSSNRPPPPRDLPRTTANSTSNSANSSPYHESQQSTTTRTTATAAATGTATATAAATGTATATATVTTTGTTTTATSSSSSSSGSRVAGARPTRWVATPTDTEEGFEIVELTEDWSGDVDEAGPVPVVEEISDSAGGTVSSPTSPGEQNTLSSSTTSLGEPNVMTSSTSSPSHELSPTHEAADNPLPADEEMSEPAHAEQLPPENTDLQTVRPPVITLNTIKTLEELQKMPVKQIKDLLMRNRVDFRGCCERTELVERATRLWIENQESKKALETLGTTEMCKICMDAPIECVMLECGHMATCMSCGKQLSECPLCRHIPEPLKILSFVEWTGKEGYKMQMGLSSFFLCSTLCFQEEGFLCWLIYSRQKTG